MINSGFLNGLSAPDESILKTIKYLEENKLGNKKTNYRLKDWGISRQRYWGCPIPIAYDENKNVVKIPEKDLPVALPNIEKLDRDGNPLNNHEKWYYLIKTIFVPSTNKTATIGISTTVLTGVNTTGLTVGAALSAIDNVIGLGVLNDCITQLCDGRFPVESAPSTHLCTEPNRCLRCPNFTVRCETLASS